MSDRDRPSYDNIRDSGVFDVLLSVVDEPSLLQQLSTDEYVARRLQLQMIYNRRAEIRNRLRGWIERNEWLSGLFDLPPIPEMTGAEILAEDQALHERELKKLLIAERDNHPVKGLAHAAAFPNFHPDHQTMEDEEKAKYVASQMQRYISRDRYADARNVFTKAQNRTYNLQQDAAHRRVGEAVSVKAVRSCLEKGNAENIVRALFELGAITDFSVRDFDDLPQEVLQNPAIISAICKKLGEKMIIHPMLYAKVRDYFCGLGLLKTETADRSPEVQRGAEWLLIQSFRKHHEIFVRFRNILTRMNIMTVEETQKHPGIQHQAYLQLCEAMRSSPDIYLAMRSEFVEKNILEREQQFDDDEKIQQLFLGHLLCWKDVHFSAYGKFRFHWAKQGLSEPPHPDKAAQVHAKTEVYEHGGKFSDYSTEDVEDGDVGDTVCEAFAAEKERVREQLARQPYIENQALEKITGEVVDYCTLFYQQYPQFDNRDLELKEMQLK